ncbi:hypothetical protein BDV95DRAFT_606179 [Massariosphaeria phaeospora]|uniref:Uncharacterized protein n=1 Tax=Massariosphaeria phaeospora TaxID=100035 RepID=A0A7C8MM64_9PLEO|nr:hypothetical protein BDV95DRAFT_606179 [Massariosphaeria phaeospora]
MGMGIGMGMGSPLIPELPGMLFLAAARTAYSQSSHTTTSTSGFGADSTDLGSPCASQNALTATEMVEISQRLRQLNTSRRIFAEIQCRINGFNTYG